MNRRLRLGMLVIFFLSGGCALVYQVSWTRMFVVSLGANAYSLCAVLSAFMGGLALGSYLASYFADRSRDLLRIYFGLELGISAFALLSPAIMDLVFGAVAAEVADATLSLGLRVLMRVGLCFALLLVPTTLMGATLPVLARLFIQQDEETGQEVATLYFVNTLGGAVGAFLCGFFFIRSFGIRGTLLGTALVNVLLAVVVLALRTGFRVRSRGVPTPVTRPQPPCPPDLDRRTLLVVIGLSGFIALSYEVLWTRVLTFFVGWTVYSYAIMLTSFLLGLAVGSAGYALFIRKRFDSIAVLALLQIGTGLFAMLSIPLFGLLDPILTSAFDSGFGFKAGHRTALKFLVSLLIMLPTTTLLGATFSAAVQVGHAGLERVAKTVGSLLAVNTAGNILGVVAATFLLIPLLGDARASVLLMAVGNILLGAFLLLMGKGIHRVRRRRWAVALVPLSVLAAYVCLPKVPILAQTYVYRHVFEDPKILYNRQGVTTTAAVVEEGSERTRLLIINGLEVASAGALIGGDSYNNLISYYGMLLHPDPQEVFVVGLASGQTATAVLAFQEVENLETVEISGEVIGALPYFDGPLPRLVSDARSSLIWEDARIYLLGTQKKYDVIISDVLLSATTGTAHLLSQEFFAICREHLKPGGLMVFEWTPHPRTIAPSILRTFSSVFQTVAIYSTPAPDSPSMFVVGSEAPIVSDIEAIGRRLQSPVVGPAFRVGGIETGEQLLQMRVDTAVVARNLASHPVVTDDRPLIDFIFVDNYPAGRE